MTDKQRKYIREYYREYRKHHRAEINARQNLAQRMKNNPDKARQIEEVKAYYRLPGGSSAGLRRNHGRKQNPA